MTKSLVPVLSVLTLIACTACGAGAGRGRESAPWTGARALTGKEDSPAGVASDGTRVLFTTGRTQVGENAVREVHLDGTAGSRIVASTPGNQIPNGALAIDGDTLYIAAGSGILRMPISGGAAVTVVDKRPALVQDVVIAGADLWWTTYQYGEPNRIEVARVPKAGNAAPVEVAAVDVAGGLNDPHPDRATAVVGTPKGVLRVQAGRPPEVVAGSDVVGGAVTHLAMDSERYYVLTAGSSHRLLAIPRRGGPPVVLAGDVDSTATLVVAGDDIVFFKARTGSSGRSTLQAVAGSGGEVRTIATGPYAYGDLVAVGSNQVAFSADDRVWIAAVR